MLSDFDKRSTAERCIDALNAENAKKLALLFVIGFIGYHGLLHLRYGPDSCSWLLSSGRYKGDHEWQPYGCMLHRYSQTDTRHCLRYLAFWGNRNNFAFIGDSRLQQLYEYFISILKSRSSMKSSFSAVKKPLPNYTYIDTKLRLSVEFIWSDDVSKTMVDQFQAWKNSATPPSVIVASSSVTLMKNQNTKSLIIDEYQRNLTRIVQAIDKLSANKTKVLWKLLEPVDNAKLKSNYKMITNADIDLYNRAAIEILSHSTARIWSAPRLVAAGSLSADGGFSLSDTALRHSAQILLNMYCNDHMNFNDGSCCASAEPYTTLQLVTFAIFLVCVILATAEAIWIWCQSCRQRSDVNPLVNNFKGAPASSSISPLAALARIGLIMAYFYLCDRTNFFMKENKYYSEWSFWLPVGYLFVLGLFFTEESRSTRVLHREQTSEWKGWMQLVILVYHVTGASKVLPIYMLVRALVSGYLFLTGYGHLCYTWQTGDTSLVRYFRVIFRLNFLTVVLCLAMNRPYQFYNFVPLVSFWFTLMYVVVALPPHVTGDTKARFLRVLLKVLGLLGIVTVLYISEVFFQKVFVTRPWKALFVTTDDDIHQWWLRWKQDRYSITYGMIFGVAFLLAQRYNLLDDNNHSNLLKPGLALSATLAAFIGIGSYTTFILFCDNVLDCNEIHSYVAFVPIVSYILLRNLTGAFRTRHSSLFAWFGNISLELFASQSHIWLAADTHGVLVLIPGAPVWNLMLTSYIFVCAAHEIHRLTAIIIPYAVPDDWNYSITYGMIFGVAFLLAQRYNLLDDNNHSNLLKPGLALSATLAAFIGIGSYTTFILFCDNVLDCNEIHSYVAFVPIVSYILLRNLTGAFRTRHSSLFAWFGNISLELFASQSHIWLAADTHGVLVLIPGAPVWNLMLTSYIFVCAAHEIHRLTAIIIPYAVPDDWKLVLRNFAIFLAVLVPIGIHDGMF